VPSQFLGLDSEELRHDRNRSTTRMHDVSSEDTSPRVSVITVVYDNRDTIENTLISVLRQDYGNLEYVVVDGNSTDGTRAVLAKYRDKISHLVSEPDSGIYDAMNKGVRIATGDWLCFMNSGDTFHSSTTVTEVFAGLSDEVDIIVGQTVADYGYTKRTIRTSTLVDSTISMPFCHQSAFSRRVLHSQFPFDLRYRIAADFKFFLSAFLDNARIRYIGTPISIISVGGISDSQRTKSVMDSRHIVKSLKGWSLQLELSTLSMLADLSFRRVAKQILPNAFSNYLTRLKSSRR